MKKVIVFTILLVFVLYTNCRKEISLQSKEFPVFITKEAKNIDSLGVTLSSQIIDYGQSEIIEYGFLLNTNYAHYAYNNNDDIHGDEFEIRVNSLVANSTHEFRAYMKTVNKTIYTNTVSFISKGSEFPFPTVTQYYPKTVSSGSCFIIEGKNLNMYIDDRKIMIYNQEPIINIWNDTIIQLVIPACNWNDRRTDVIIWYSDIIYELPIN